MNRPQMTLIACACVAMAALSLPIAAQPTQHVLSDGTPVSFPPLTITGTQIAADTTYDTARGVYRYTYTVTAPTTNQAPINGIKIDVSGRIARSQTDPALQENVRRLGELQPPATAIPVGITVTDPGVWRGGVGKGSNLFVATPKEGAGILPGTTFRFVVESKLPPGERTVEIMPSGDSWWAIVDALPEGEEFEDPPDESVYVIKTTTIGPSDPDESTLFNGGGQSPAEVNPFLRYVAPTDSRTKLPAGTSTYTLVVKFGTTTMPETFTATFNGVDVRSRFQPVPGAVNAVKFDLQPGSNKVQLSIEGVTSSARTARDTDSLTLLVP